MASGCDRAGTDEFGGGESGGALRASLRGSEPGSPPCRGGGGLAAMPSLGRKYVAATQGDGAEAHKRGEKGGILAWLRPPGLVPSAPGGMDSVRRLGACENLSLSGRH